jgi:hypothetical protein
LGHVGLALLLLRPTVAGVVAHLATGVAHAAGRHLARCGLSLCHDRNHARRHHLSCRPSWSRPSSWTSCTPHTLLQSRAAAPRRSTPGQCPSSSSAPPRAGGLSPPRSKAHSDQGASPWRWPPAPASPAWSGEKTDQRRAHDILALLTRFSDISIACLNRITKDAN